MGIRRLRQRLDQLQGKANFTMDDAAELIGMAKEMIDNVTDGVGIRFKVDEKAAKALIGIMLGKPGELPITIQIDPAYDTLPSREVRFIDGPYDGKTFRIPDTEEKSITLKGGHRYQWDGYGMKYQDKD